MTSCLALFIALGGTGYAAVTLPRNSVGSAQLRSKSVGSSELKSERRDVARDQATARSRRATCRPTARASLRGQAGPAGPAGPAGTTFRAAVPSGGTVAAGNATRATHVGRHERVHGRVPAATSAAASRRRRSPRCSPGRRLEQPEAGRITVATSGAAVVVKTYRADGAAGEQPFNVIVAC